MRKLTKLIAIFIAMVVMGSCQYLMENPLTDGKYSTSPRKGQNLVEVVIGESDLSILEAAVVQAGLADALSQPGPFTIFAPTDEAFAAAGIDLNTVSDEDLANILKYHVVAAGLLTKNLQNRPYTTLNGEDLFVSKDYDQIFVNGGSKLVEFNIVATNGIIHKINKVLMPPAGDIVDIAVGSNPEEFNSLVAAVLKAELADALKSDGPFTVFAPTDAAFAKFFNDLGVSLDDVSKEDVAAILKYHVLADRLFSSDLETQSYETLSGEDIHVNVENGVVINGDVNVIAPDILASNGVIHVIDMVLMPKTLSIVDIAVNTPRFSTLVAALQAADLVGALQGDGPFTVFAPNNAAFDKLPAGVLEALLKPENKELLQSILLYHVDDAEILSTDLRRGANTVKPLGGSFFNVFNLPHRPLFIRDLNRLSPNAKIINADIKGTNGVIHEIDEVLLPKDVKF